MSPRRRRMLSDFDRREVVDTLNRLRRSVGAPNMYYAVCSSISRLLNNVVAFIFSVGALLFSREPIAFIRIARTVPRNYLMVTIVSNMYMLHV